MVIQDVYVDILFLINFSMDYLCLYICSKILHRKIRLGKMLLAASIGGIYSVISLFLPLSHTLELALDSFVCLALCLIVYCEKGRGISSLLTSSFLFVGISMMTGGCMTAIFNLLNKLELPLDSIGSDNISSYLFAALAAVAGMISLKSGQVASKRSSIRECRLQIRFCDKDFDFIGLCDSGNLVRDPISGKAVIFLEKSLLEKQLSLGFFDDFLRGSLSNDAPCKNLRVISIKTASGSSVTVAASPEKITAKAENKKGKEITLPLDALIAPADIGKSAHGYTAIIPLQIIKE